MFYDVVLVVLHVHVDQIDHVPFFEKGGKGHALDSNAHDSLLISAGPEAVLELLLLDSESSFDFGKLTRGPDYLIAVAGGWIV